MVIIRNAEEIFSNFGQLRVAFDLPIFSCRMIAFYSISDGVSYQDTEYWND